MQNNSGIWPDIFIELIGPNLPGLQLVAYQLVTKNPVSLNHDGIVFRENGYPEKHYPEADVLSFLKARDKNNPPSPHNLPTGRSLTRLLNGYLGCCLAELTNHLWDTENRKTLSPGAQWFVTEVVLKQKTWIKDLKINRYVKRLHQQFRNYFPEGVEALKVNIESRLASLNEPSSTPVQRPELDKSTARIKKKIATFLNAPDGLQWLYRFYYWLTGVRGLTQHITKLTQHLMSDGAWRIHEKRQRAAAQRLEFSKQFSRQQTLLASQNEEKNRLRNEMLQWFEKQGFTRSELNQLLDGFLKNTPDLTLLRYLPEFLKSLPDDATVSSLEVGDYLRFMNSVNNHETGPSADSFTWRSDLSQLVDLLARHGMKGLGHVALSQFFESLKLAAVAKQQMNTANNQEKTQKENEQKLKAFTELREDLQEIRKDFQEMKKNHPFLTAEHAEHLEAFEKHYEKVTALFLRTEEEVPTVDCTAEAKKCVEKARLVRARLPQNLPFAAAHSTMVLALVETSDPSHHSELYR